MKTNSRTIPFPAWRSWERYGRVRGTLKTLSSESHQNTLFKCTVLVKQLGICLPLSSFSPSSLKKSQSARHWSTHWANKPSSRTIALHAGHVICRFRGLDSLYLADTIMVELCCLPCWIKQDSWAQLGFLTRKKHASPVWQVNCVALFVSQLVYTNLYQTYIYI